MRVRSENGKDFFYTLNNNYQSQNQSLHEMNKNEEEKRNFKCDIFHFIQKTASAILMTPLQIYNEVTQKEELVSY